MPSPVIEPSWFAAFRKVFFPLVGRLLFQAVLAFLFCLVSAELLGSSLWFFGLPFTLVLLQYFEVAVANGSRTLKKIPTARLRLNMKASGISKLPVVWPFQVRFFVLALVLLSCFFYAMRDRVAESFVAVAEALRKEEVMLRIEYPTFAELPALETLLADKNQEFTADTGSYIQLFVKNKKPSTQWQLQIQAQSTGKNSTENTGTNDIPSVPLASQNESLSASGNFAQSMASLYSLFKLSEKEGARFVFTLSNDGKKTRTATVNVSPVPVPVVNLELLSSSQDQGSTAGDPGAAGKLNFSVRAQSKVPLALVELSVRTESGYRFNKTLGEFANSNQLDFESKLAELSTFGIPFSANDILYVKAVAKTVVAGLEGESRELNIVIKNRQQIREQVIEKLLNALKELRSNEKPFAESQTQIQEDLHEAESAANSLGRQSTASRQTRAAQEDARTMAAKGDKNAKAAEKKIESALESLKREADSEDMGNLFARLQSLKSSISRANDDELKNISKDAQKLKADAEQMHEKLSQALQSPSANLSPEEMQAAQSMLGKDKTAQKLEATAEALGQGKRNESAQGATEAFDESQKSMGSVMQLLQAARARAMKEARERLTTADGQLEQAKGKTPQKAQGQVEEAQKELGQTPQLSQEFNEALSEAQEAGKDAQKKAQKGNPEFQDAVQQTQEGIVKALSALQDEEESQRQQSRDQDGQNYRTAMDALAAQGQLDVGWRKRILDEIARLRGRGEGADSPLIKYLESRLR